MVMGERSTLTAGKKSLLGEESRDEGLEEKEWGDMGLASGEKPPCCSTDGMITDRAVAEADLMTLLPALEFRFSPSPDKC